MSVSTALQHETVRFKWGTPHVEKHSRDRRLLHGKQLNVDKLVSTSRIRQYQLINSTICLQSTLAHQECTERCYTHSVLLSHATSPCCIATRYLIAYPQSAFNKRSLSRQPEHARYTYNDSAFRLHTQIIVCTAIAPRSIQLHFGASI